MILTWLLLGQLHMEPWQGSSSHILFRSFGIPFQYGFPPKKLGITKVYIWYGFAANLICLSEIGLPIPSIGYLSISHKLIVNSPFSGTSKYHIVGQKSWNSHCIPFYTSPFFYIFPSENSDVSCQKPIENSTVVVPIRSTEFWSRLGERHCLCLRRWSMELHQAWRMPLGDGDAMEFYGKNLEEHDFILVVKIENPNWLDRK